MAPICDAFSDEMLSVEIALSSADEKAAIWAAEKDRNWSVPKSAIWLVRNP